MTLYLDSYGTIEPEKYSVTMPKDLYYCDHCKSPDTPSVGIFTQFLRDSLPNPSEFFRLKSIDDKIESFMASASKRRKMSVSDTEQLTSLQQKRRDILSSVIRKSIGKSNSFM
jgi:hypothetical protein